LNSLKIRLVRSLMVLVAMGAGLAPLYSRAQALSDAALEEAGGITGSATTNDLGPVGIVPIGRGLNASLISTSQHDSSNGWSSLLTPDVAFRFNRYLSVDASTPVYTYIDVYARRGKKPNVTYVYKTRYGALGDTALAFHGDAESARLSYNGTFTLGLPTGNTAYGLGAGQVTYNINNHMEHDFDWFTPDIELGFGDTSSLVDQRVRKSYVAVGPLANFQAGGGAALPHGLYFEADAYEELPLASDIVYSTTGKGKKRVRTSTNRGPAEDNGFITSLDIPVASHLTLSGFYDRSLRDSDDVAGFSMTFLLRPPPKPASLSD
jgi:hypothetical protein